ncbi:hypothetical protein Tco_0297167, partial [Tanacetum coccineum]
GDSWGCVPRSLFWREDLDGDRERGFNCLTFALVSSKAHRTLRVADSHAGNHPEDGFTPLEKLFEGLPDVLELKDVTACHLKISAITPPAWKNHLDNHIEVDLSDLYDRYYARQAVVDNTVNRRSRELFQVIKKLR